MVTGLVPNKRQLAEYRNKFLTAASSDPAQDVPRYWGFYFQRAEVPAAKEEPKWSKPVYVGAKEMTDAINRVSGKTQAEPADPRFILPPLTSPLPLLADVSWGSEAVYPPQIPVVEHAADAGAGATAAGAASLAPVNPAAGQPRVAYPTPVRLHLEYRRWSAPALLGLATIRPGGPARAENPTAVDDSQARIPAPALY